MLRPRALRAHVPCAKVWVQAIPNRKETRIPLPIEEEGEEDETETPASSGGVKARPGGNMRWSGGQPWRSTLAVIFGGQLGWPAGDLQLCVVAGTFWYGVRWARVCAADGSPPPSPDGLPTRANAAFRVLCTALRSTRPVAGDARQALNAAGEGCGATAPFGPFWLSAPTRRAKGAKQGIGQYCCPSGWPKHRSPLPMAAIPPLPGVPAPTHYPAERPRVARVRPHIAMPAAL